MTLVWRHISFAIRSRDIIADSGDTDAEGGERMEGEQAVWCGGGGGEGRGWKVSRLCGVVSSYSAT